MKQNPPPKDMDDKWLEQTENKFLVKLDSATHIYRTLQQAHEEHYMHLYVDWNFRTDMRHYKQQEILPFTGLGQKWKKSDWYGEQ